MLESKVFKDLQDRYTAALKLIATNNNCSIDIYEIENATAHLLAARSKWFVSGISGSGKSTITKILVSSGYKRLRNITTRAKRPEETDDDNIFIDNATFELWNAQDKIFHPHITNEVWHGMLHEDIARLSGDEKLYLDKSIKSTLTIYQELQNGTLSSINFVYILPPSFNELVERLAIREKLNAVNGMNPAQIANRLTEEITEMEQSALLPYAYIVNDDPSRVIGIIESILV